MTSQTKFQNASSHNSQHFSKKFGSTFRKQKTEDMSKDLYQVEGIVGFKQVRGAPHYKVRWLGYSSRHDTWEPASNLTPCDDLIEEYHSRTAVAKTETRRNARRSLVPRRAGPSAVEERPIRRSQRARTPTTYYTSEVPTRRRRSLTPKPAKKEERPSTGSEETLELYRSEYELRSHATPRKSPRKLDPQNYFNSELPHSRRSPHPPKKTAEEEEDAVTNTYQLHSRITGQSAAVSSLALSSDEESEKAGDTLLTPQISDYESQMRKRLSSLSKMTRKSIKDALTSLTETDSAPLTEADSAPLTETDSAPLTETDSAPLTEADSAPLTETDSAPLTEHVEPSTVSQPPKLPTAASSCVYGTHSHTTQSQSSHQHNKLPTTRMQLRSGKPSLLDDVALFISSADGPGGPRQRAKPYLPTSSDVSPSEDGPRQEYPRRMQLGWEEVMFTLLIVGLLVFAYYCFYSDRC